MSTGASRAGTGDGSDSYFDDDDGDDDDGDEDDDESDNDSKADDYDGGDGDDKSFHLKTAPLTVDTSEHPTTRHMTLHVVRIDKAYWRIAGSVA